MSHSQTQIDGPIRVMRARIAASAAVPIPSAPVRRGDHTAPIQLVAARTNNIWLTTDIFNSNGEVPGPLRSLVLHRDGTGWHWIKVPFADLALEAASGGHGGMWASAEINSPSTA